MNGKNDSVVVDGSGVYFVRSVGYVAVVQFHQPSDHPMSVDGDRPYWSVSEFDQAQYTSSFYGEYISTF